MKYLLMILLALALSGCVTSYADNRVNKTSFMENLSDDTTESLAAMSPAEKEIYRKQWEVCYIWFSQPRTEFKRGKYVHQGYRQWHIIKETGSVKYYELWINDEGKIFDVPYRNDNTPIKVPGKDVTISP